MSTLFLRLIFAVVGLFKGRHSQANKSSYWQTKPTRHQHYECY